MPRYTRNGRTKFFWFDDDHPLIPNLTVEMNSPQETGLFDANGEPLYKLPDEIGFVAKLKTGS